MSCEILPQISGITGQTLQEYTLIPGVVRTDTGNGESRRLEGTWSFTEKENLEVIPELGETKTCDLIFTPKDDNYPYYKVKDVEVHVEKRPRSRLHFMNRQVISIQKFIIWYMWICRQNFRRQKGRYLFLFCNRG